MGMTRQEFSILVKAMKAVYPMQTFIPDQYAFDVWYESLKDIQYKFASQAVQNLFKSSRFIPTIADIRDKVTEIVNMENESLSEMQAWDMVYRAICNSAYNSEKEFEKLPDNVKKAVGKPLELQSWARMDITDVNSVVQSNFLRSYRTVVQNEKKQLMYGNKLKEMLETKESKMIGEKSNEL